MRTPALIISLVQWRWTPSVALVVGSLAFVGIVILVVPDDFDSVTSGADQVSRAAARGRMTKNAESVTETSLPSDTGDEVPESAAEKLRAGLPKRGHSIVQSIFHPVQKAELPVEPVDPNPPPPPPEAPLPPPTNTIYTLQNPPPAPPNPGALPVPATPEAPAVPPAAAPPTEPQGITGNRQ
jgi:outer membrane biosynthesis protein TonB